MKGILGILGMLFLSSGMYAQDKMSFSLDEAIAYALENSYNAKVAVNDVKAAEKKVWETTTIGLPQINAKVDYQHWIKQQISLLPAEIFGGTPGTFSEVTFGTQQTLNATVTLKQLLFDGSYLVGLQSARTYLQISKLAQDKTTTLTKEAVINAYGNVLVAEKSIEILEGNKVILEKNLYDAKQILKNGLNEEEDVEQLEITLGTIESQLNNVRRLKTIAYQMLNITLGNSIATEITLSDSLDSLTALNIDLELVATPFNIENHIDFKIAENDKESNRLLMQYERSKALPSLSAFINYGQMANSDTFTFFNSNQTWFDSSLLGVSLNVPIFSSLQRSSKTAQAKIAFENSDIRLEETKQRLNLQAQSAKSEYQLSIENYETAKRNLLLSERIEKKQRIKFFEGISTSFDLATAQNQLYTQQQNYIQSMLDVINKKAALATALNLSTK